MNLINAKNVYPVLLFMVILVISGHTQTITLSFTAEHDGSHIPLDSILIENLSQPGDTILYAPDTVLVLDYTVSVGELFMTDDQVSVSQSYPNPISDKTSFTVKVQEEREVSITIRDILGRDLVRQNFLLDRGEHTYTFFPGNEKLYLLTVSGKHESTTIKMLNSRSGHNRAGNERLVYNQKEQATGKYTIKTKSEFIFNLGDLLKYTGYTIWGTAVITDNPMSNQTYTFQYSGNHCPGVPIVTDIDGNEYNTLLIGSQCWLAENLRTTTYRNGTPIPNVTDDGEWSKLSTGAYVWYDNDTNNKDTYGALYNWYAIMNLDGLCPEGWHVPDNNDWDTLTNYIGGTGSPYGNMLKSCRQVNSPLGGDCSTDDHPRWAEHVTHYGTDDYGFGGLPGGTRHYLTGFVTLGYIGSYWSSTVSTSNYGWLRGLEYNEGHVDIYAFYKKNGYSVRCVRD